jgi:hypothetical protein
MGQPVAETLQRKYDEAVQNANGDGPSVVDGGVKKKVEVLPTLDAHGRLYDVGHGKGDGETMPGNCKKKEKVLRCTLIITYRSAYTRGFLV